VEDPGGPLSREVEPGESRGSIPEGGVSGEEILERVVHLPDLADLHAVRLEVAEKADVAELIGRT
jgi:hypothetical protein